MGDGLVELMGDLGGFFPGELSGAVEAVLFGLGIIYVLFQGGLDGCSDVADAAGIEKSSGGTDDFGDGGGVGAGDGSAAGHGF